jgi:RimJ/RimL family protein N-acetyltransferase
VSLAAGFRHTCPLPSFDVNEGQVEGRGRERGGSWGASVLLREVDEDDLEVFFKQQLDPEATAMAAFPARDRETHFAHWRNVAANATAVSRTVLVDGQVAGNVGSWELDGERYVGYWFGKSYWGRGVATSALSQFLEVLSTRPLYAHVAQHNRASIRVLEKCGFRFIGEKQADDVIELTLVLDE